MPKMKYWNGTQWVPLDAANADTLEGLTVSQIRAGTTKTDVGLGNVDNVKQASKTEFDAHVAEFDAHVADNLPHITADGNYRYGFNVTTAGELQFVYEEVN